MRLEPFDEMRADYRAALIAQQVFNMAVDPKHRLTIDKFLLKFGDQPEKPKQDQFALMKVLAAAYATDTGDKPRGADPDKALTDSMKEQVAKAHAAMNASPELDK